MFVLAVDLDSRRDQCKDAEELPSYWP